MQLNNIEMVVRVKNRVITEYTHNGQTFIEGRAGSNYEIEIRNHTFMRAEAVISVDGLSVIDGKEAGAHSMGYLIEPQATINIPGWMLDANRIAKFAFAGKTDSYASQISQGKTLNNGVIGVMVFGARTVMHSPYAFNKWPISQNSQLQNNAIQDHPRGIAPIETKTSGGFMNAVGMPGVVCSANNLSYTAATQQSLGTAFGDASQFSTRTTSFDRGALLSTMSLYYDNIKGLRARGILIERKGKRRQPNAFPASTGCVPPPNWS